MVPYFVDDSFAVTGNNNNNNNKELYVNKNIYLS